MADRGGTTPHQPSGDGIPRVSTATTPANPPPNNAGTPHDFALDDNQNPALSNELNNHNRRRQSIRGEDIGGANALLAFANNGQAEE